MSRCPSLSAAPVGCTNALRVPLDRCFAPHRSHRVRASSASRARQADENAGHHHALCPAETHRSGVNGRAYTAFSLRKWHSSRHMSSSRSESLSSGRRMRSADLHRSPSPARLARAAPAADDRRRPISGWAGGAGTGAAGWAMCPDCRRPRRRRAPGRVPRASGAGFERCRQLRAARASLLDDSSSAGRLRRPVPSPVPGALRRYDTASGPARRRPRGNVRPPRPHGTPGTPGPVEPPGPGPRPAAPPRRSPTPER